MSKDDLITQLLKEVRDDQKTHSGILVDLQTNVAKNTEDLADHIEGVKQNRKHIQHIDERIIKLEEPRKLLKFFSTLVLKLAGLVGAIYGIVKAVKYFNLF